MTYRILYRAKAVYPPLGKHDRDILRTAQAFNAQHSITGFLLRSEMDYFQILEGRENCLRPLLKRIQGDRRQRDFKMLWSGPVLYPLFADWAMEMHVLGREDIPLQERLKLLSPRTLEDEKVGSIRDIAHLAYVRYSQSLCGPA